MNYQHTIKFHDGMRVKFSGYGSSEFYGTIKFMGADYVIKWDDLYNTTPVGQIRPDRLEVVNPLLFDVESDVQHIANTIRKALIPEIECKSCRKKNDAGVKSCWWCGCCNPTETK